MSVATVSEVLSGLVAAAAAGAGLGDAGEEGVVPSGQPQLGDYQSNLAFRMAKAARQSPRQVAERLQAALPAHPAVASTSVAGPGFLNFTLDDAWLCALLRQQVEDPAGGIPQRGAGRTVVIDFSAPNVAKRMHVGHMRSTLIGDALVRLHRAAGWTVIGDNHIGDWGTPFGRLIVAWRRWLDEAAFQADPLGELERLYVKAHAEADAAFDALARAETAKLQAGDAENRALWRRFLEVSLAEFEAIYRRLGVRFDETLGESAYHDRLPALLDELLARGVAEPSEGAVVIRYTAEDGKGLADTTLVVRKADGAWLYGTTDLATLRYRLDRWAPARIVYVTDTRQQLHFQQIFAAARRMGWDGVELVHTWFGMLVLPEGGMSSRKGNVVRLVDFLDEASRRARAVVDEKSPEIPEPERAAIAEAVGMAAVRYADLSQNPQSNVTFDWDRMLSLDGNTAPYLLYSNARCRSIQRKGEIQEPDVAGLAVEHPLERAVLLHLVRFPEIVAIALETRRPNLLCDHLFELANAFNRFYYELPVLQAERARTRLARLALVEATARVLERGFQILGLPVLRRM